MLAWLRNLIRPPCPQCEGAAGFHDPYGGDWSGCSCCNPNEDREEEYVRVWFWQVWRYRYDLWKLDRWVDREVAKMEAEDGIR
jgi:hypothetical protein